MNNVNALSCATPMGSFIVLDEMSNELRPRCGRKKIPDSDWSGSQYVNIWF